MVVRKALQPAELMLPSTLMTSGACVVQRMVSWLARQHNFCGQLNSTLWPWPWLALAGEQNVYHKCVGCWLAACDCSPLPILRASKQQLVEERSSLFVNRVCKSPKQSPCHVLVCSSSSS
jgi:hypothetical protein